MPSRLLQAFRELEVEPVLSGGSAVQVWTGRRDGCFETHDLDFITSISVRDLERVGIRAERSGRHVVVDGVAVEFPSGPLAVGDLILDPIVDSRLVPTLEGDEVRCIRPEACVLDRLTFVAGTRTASCFLQAAEVAVIQASASWWDDGWIDRSAGKAGLARLWNHLKAELEGGHPTAEALGDALKIGWDY